MNTLVFAVLLLCVVLSTASSSFSLAKNGGLKITDKRKNQGRRGGLLGLVRRQPTDNLVAKLHIPHSSLAKVNVLMLLFYSTLGASMPFIPLWYRRLGLPDNEVGLLGAITPAITFLVSPLWGAFADKTGWHKHIMLLTFVGSVIARCGLMFTKNFYWLASVVIVTAVLNAPVKPLLDSAVMGMLEDKADYGRSRLFGQLGFGLGSWFVGPFLSGLPMHMRFIFPAQAFLAIPTILLMLDFQPKNEEKGKQKKREDTDFSAALRHVVTDPKFLVFYFVVFVIGVSSGIIENFGYVRLSEIIAAGQYKWGEGQILGICRLLSSAAGGPMFWFSGDIIKRIGVNGVLTWSIVSYVLRFVIYASVRNPWHAIPAEIMRGSSFAVFFAGCTTYVYNSSPKGLTATMLGLLNGIYGGLGQSVGALVGGALSKRHGIAKSFYICSGIDVALLVTFILYQIFIPDGHRHEIPERPVGEEVVVPDDPKRKETK